MIFRERGKEGGEGEKHDVWEIYPLARPQLGTWPATQGWTLAGNRTSDLSVHRPALNPLSHTSQGPACPFLKCGLVQTKVQAKPDPVSESQSTWVQTSRQLHLFWPASSVPWSPGLWLLHLRLASSSRPLFLLTPFKLRVNWVLPSPFVLETQVLMSIPVSKGNLFYMQPRNPESGVQDLFTQTYILFKQQ